MVVSTQPVLVYSSEIPFEMTGGIGFRQCVNSYVNIYGSCVGVAEFGESTY